MKSLPIETIMEMTRNKEIDYCSALGMMYVVAKEQSQTLKDVAEHLCIDEIIELTGFGEDDAIRIHDTIWMN